MDRPLQYARRAVLVFILIIVFQRVSENQPFRQENQRGTSEGSGVAVSRVAYTQLEIDEGGCLALPRQLLGQVGGGGGGRKPDSICIYIYIAIVVSRFGFV